MVSSSSALAVQQGLVSDKPNKIKQNPRVTGVEGDKEGGWDKELRAFRLLPLAPLSLARS